MWFAVGMVIGGIFTLITHAFEDEICFQLFYFKVFILTLGMVVVWVSQFGTKTLFISWTYNDIDGNITLPERWS